MGTAVFDFDSTLIPGESLEMALAEALADDPQAQARVEALTQAGMEGRLPFEESLRRRLALARPTRPALERLGQRLTREGTSGAKALVQALTAAGHAVWIVSGAFRDVLLPTARALGVPEEHVHGVRALWRSDGAFDDLDPADSFVRSKVEGVRALNPAWARPAVGIGDGMTDHALWAAGLVDAFVPYVEHTRRDAVMALGLPSAATMEELALCLQTHWS